MWAINIVKSLLHSIGKHKPQDMGGNSLFLADFIGIWEIRDGDAAGAD